ncbi:hypothetical protein JOC78_001498 [Bacillus ectoiniformans]|uniref:YhcN/YlaJ family sporulation lipoprotein n=1 Tax=Bacillus ectoiniformans TaxID=1494429 RepID=UPI00195EC3A1|nr:YhcN/YlaJ family sporulation lipoprotein [Bacillus ectoiniformans]MBM7648552.1 hypothetical protein [Bacillus ectoiniformans]
MKKPLLAMGVASFVMLAGCNMNNDNAADEQGMVHKNGNTLNVRDREDLYNENETRTYKDEVMTKRSNAEFGYVRQQKSPIQGQTVSYKDMYTMDRERTADAISKLSVANPSVNDCSVLVTDEEVLIAYDTDAKTKKERMNAADQVKRTAMSVVPRWYHVYVTDDTGLRRDIENIAPMGPNMDGAEDTIEKTIKLMKANSPQGKSTVEGENPNGETKADKEM